MTQLPVFDKYFTKEDAEYYYKLFVHHGLNPSIDQPKTSQDAIFGSTHNNLFYILRLPAANFAEAGKLIEQEIRKNKLPEDYYLHQMDNSELYEILTNPKEWSRQDVAAAKILLEQRYCPIDEIKLNEDKELEKLKQRDKQKISIPNLLLFYAIAPFGAFFPVIAGLVIYYLKETDVEGKKDYAFSPRYRIHGLLISVIGIISCIAWIYWLRSL